MMGESKIRMALVGTTALMAWMGLASGVDAASITVNATTTVAGTGCSFEEAITSVNNQAAFDKCTITGTGTINAITIPGNSNPYVASNINDDIHRSVTISGPTTGTSLAILQFSGGSGDSGLHMSGGSGISITLQNLTVRGTQGNLLAGVYNVDTNLTLNTVHLTNFGYAGLHNNTGAVQVNNSTIDGNGVFGSLPLGGGISNGGTLTVTGSTIANNFAFQGGGILDTGGVSLMNSVVSGNTSIDAGGGVYTTAGGSLTDSTISGNSSGAAGGGIYSTAGMGFTRTVIDSNTSDDRGGGVYIAATGGAAFNQSTVSNNSSSSDGGGICIDGADSNTDDTYDGTMVNDNFAGGNGGGLYTTGEEFPVRNSSFVHNTATNGGGIYRSGGGEFHILHGTIANNSATQMGGGLAGTTPGPVFFGTIIASNTAGVAGTGDLDLMRTDPIGNYCLIGDPGAFASAFPASSQNLTGNPGFGTLQNLGGPTAVLPLLNGSQAIDWIPASEETGNSITTDQRGANFLRPRDGNDGANPPRNGGDIGAYEQYVNIFEIENQTVAAHTAGINATHVSNARASAGAMGQLPFTNATNSPFVTYQVANVPMGTFTLIVRVRKGSNGGIFRLAAASTVNGTYTNIGGTQDTYATSDTWTELSLGSLTISSTGTKFFRFTVTGKNTNSSGFQIFPDFIMPR